MNRPSSVGGQRERKMKKRIWGQGVYRMVFAEKD